MGRLLDLAKALAGEKSLSGTFGRWILAVSGQGDQIPGMQGDLDTAEVLITALLAQNVIPDGMLPGQPLTWNEATANEWAGSDIAPLYVAPTGWATFIALVNANSYVRPVVMGSGAWSADSQEITNAGASVEGRSGVVISYDVRPVGLGPEAAAVFYHNEIPAATTTVSVLGVVGARTLTVASAAGISIGDRIAVQETNIFVRGYEVVNKAGAVITLDAALPYPFPIGSTVTVIPLAQQCRDIRINGGGMSLVPAIPATPLADKLIELFAAWDCVISDLKLDASGAVLMGCSYDMGGVRNKWERILEDGGGNTDNGIGLEGQRDSSIEECSTRDNAFCGYGLGSCTSCTVKDSSSDADVIGVYLGGLIGDVVGCSFCSILNVTVRNSAAAAVGAGYGSSYNLIDGLKADGCATGLVFGAYTGAASHHNSCKNSTVRGGNNGLVTLDGSHDNLLEGCTLVGQTGAGAYLNSGPVSFKSCRIESSGSSMIIVGTGVVASCTDLDLLYTGEVLVDGAVHMVAASSRFQGNGIRFRATVNNGAGTLTVFKHDAGVVDVSDVDLEFVDDATATIAVNILDGTFRCRNYRQRHGTYGFFITGTTARVQIEGVIDINNAGAGALVVLAGGGATQAQCNVGSFAGTGAPQDVAIPQISAQSIVRIWAPNGVPVEVAYSITPATKITLTLPVGPYYWQLIT